MQQAVKVPKEIFKEIQGLQLEPSSNGLKIILGKGKTSIARYLTRNLKLSEKGFKDNEIRDMAQTIELKLQPPELFFCKTLEDYSKMYECGPSCMSNPPGACFGNDYTPQICYDIHKKLGLWSSIFYSYVPNLQGVCLIRDGKFVARSFIDTKNKSYFSVYSDGYSGPNTTELGNLLKKEGYHSGCCGRLDGPVVVKAVKLGDDILCPMPKSDMWGSNFTINYNKAKEEFLCEYGGHTKSRYNFQWVNALDCKKV